MSDSVTPLSPDKNSGERCYALLQGIFPTQGSNLRLLRCRQTLYRRATREALMSLSLPFSILYQV